MAKHRMTDRWVNSFCAPPGKRAEIGDLLCPALHLRVSSSGNKSWSAVFRSGTAIRRVTLGRYPVVRLAEARDATLDLLRANSKSETGNHGIPAATGSALSDRAPQTLASLIDDYVTHLSARARSWKLIASNLRRREMAPLASRAAATISKRDFVEVVDGLANAGKPHAAVSLLRHLKMALNFGVERDLLAANPLIGVRPPAKTNERDRILSGSEVARVWQAAGQLPQPWAAMIRMMMLTGQRRSEVSNMRWDEIEGDLWIIPRERVKRDRPHAVPLTASALAELKPLREYGETGFVFSNDGGERAASNFHKIKQQLDELSGVSGWVLHDLRRTLRSGLAAMGVPREVARAVVNHADGKIDRIYNRHEYLTEKREALEQWGCHLNGPVRM